MKYTLLQMTQSILSNLSSDEVNSISDTSESMQVAEIIRQTYFNIISRLNVENHKQLIQLDPSLDPTSPTLMYIPEGISSIEWIKYFNSNVLDNADTTGDHDINVDIQDNSVNEPTSPPGYLYVTILPITQFIDMINKFNPNLDNIDSFTFSDNSNNYNGNYNFYYYNDRQPNFCTILSNNYVVFDSYDNTQDTTLQASKSMALGVVTPTFILADTYIPNIEEAQFPLLLNEAKALAFFELKQMVHQKAEKEANRGWTNAQVSKAITQRPTAFEALPNFGRRPMNQRILNLGN